MNDEIILSLTAVFYTVTTYFQSAVNILDSILILFMFHDVMMGSGLSVEQNKQYEYANFGLF